MSDKKDAKSDGRTPASQLGDKIYKYDKDYIEKTKEYLFTQTNPKYFKNCHVSALAAMKILKHALLGVETGRKTIGTTVEVMGFLVGKIEGDTIIVFDTIPSSVVGFENSVDIDKVLGYITACGDALERKRPEYIMGWYHSHPFDVETYSHCHLSATDVQTQTAYQNDIKEFVAIVCDPLRSLAKQEPEFGAFRVYPASHKLTVVDECPDSSVLQKELRVQRWGLSNERYYSLKISFFLSSLGRNMLDLMSKNSLWVRILASSAIMEPENRQRFSERVRKVSDKLQSSTNQLIGSGGPGATRSGGYLPGPSGKSGKGKEDLAQGTLASAELAIEQCKGHASQITKDLLFKQSS